MREILFRGKTIIDDIWVYGYYVRLDNDHYIYMIQNKLIEVETNSYENELVRYTIDLKTIGQYINKKDIKGKKIYEGDNLKCGTSPIYTVTWETDRWKMCGRKNGNGFSLDIRDFMEIIGNIHE